MKLMANALKCLTNFTIDLAYLTNFTIDLACKLTELYAKRKKKTITTT